ncbi:unnamed protein product [Musa acuminata var. zebrina]
MATEIGGRPGASLASAAALPYLVMPLTNLCLSGFLAILRSVLRPSTGVSATTFFAYYQLLGSLLLSVLALLFESGRRPKLTFRILCSAFFVGFLQIPVGGLMLLSSLRYITTTFQSVALNTIPSLVFVLAVLCRRERFRFWSVGGQAKLWGVVVSAAGAFAMVISDRDSTESSASIGSSSHADWLLGTTMVGLGVAASAIADLSVESIAFRYPADLSLSAMIAVCGTIQTFTVAAFMERDASAWKIHRKGSLQLVAILYGGILVTGLSYLGRIWCIHRKGPVFATAFSPLLVVFSFLLHTLVLGGATHLGSILAAALVAAGLYLLLWAKSTDQKMEDGDENQQVEGSNEEPLL